jgi:hypothetical protein
VRSVLFPILDFVLLGLIKQICKRSPALRFTFLDLRGDWDSLFGASGRCSLDSEVGSHAFHNLAVLQVVSFVFPRHFSFTLPQQDNRSPHLYSSHCKIPLLVILAMEIQGKLRSLHNRLLGEILLLLIVEQNLWWVLCPLFLFRLFNNNALVQRSSL